MASHGDWSTELWDIFAQPGGANMCCLSTWCPCIQYGLLLEQLPPGSVTCGGSATGGCALFCVLWLLGDVLGAALLTKVVTIPCSALAHSQTRGYIRRKYGIQSHPIHDFFITWCCTPCALCQEARETVIRQAAEREDSARPLALSRAGSVLGVDITGRQACLSGRGSGAAVVAAAAEPSPGGVLAAVSVVPLGGDVSLSLAKAQAAGATGVTSAVSSPNANMGSV